VFDTLNIMNVNWYPSLCEVWIWNFIVSWGVKCCWWLWCWFFWWWLFDECLMINMMLFWCWLWWWLL